MADTLSLYGKTIGAGHRPYIIAELSGNHGGDKERAKALIRAAKEAGADAAKIQTYTADTLTLRARNEHFLISNEGLWNGMYFCDLYEEGTLPWEWHEELAAYAQDLEIDFFSSPFDKTAVDFLETTLDPEVYKLGSHELTNIPLLEVIGKTGKLAIVSTGMGSEEEIKKALDVLRQAGASGVVLLKCISNYPAKAEGYNLRSMTLMEEVFQVPVGLSDHSMGHEMCVGAVALGASVIEKHLMLEDENESIDKGFSLTPGLFAEMVQSVDTIFRGLGQKSFGVSEQEMHELASRRSIFVAQDVAEGQVLTEAHLKIVRPSTGLSPARWKDVLGKRASKDLVFGNPLQEGDWD